MTDQVHNFIVNEGEYRGTVVQLTDAYRHITCLHPYPPALSQLLGEALAAISLFGHNIKQEGKLALQLQSQDPIRLLVVEINHHGDLRGLVQWNEEEPLKTPLYLNEGQLAITLIPAHGKQHQGIVPIIKGKLADSLAHYFGQSEQIFSRLILIANEDQAAGLFLQKMPDFADSEFRLDPATADLLLSTVQPHELFAHSAAELLGKVFYEQDIRLFESQSLQFKCHCNHNKMANAVRMLGQDDALELLKTHKTVLVTCDFCNHHYSFDQAEVEAIFSNQT